MRTLLACLLTLALAGCSTISQGIGGGDFSLDALAEVIDAPRGDDGEVTRDGRLLVQTGALLAIAEVASARALDRPSRDLLADRLERAGGIILQAADGDGYFIEADLAEAAATAKAILGEAATERLFSVLSGGVSITGAFELGRDYALAGYTLDGIRRLSLLYQSGELSEEEVRSILQERYLAALERLRS